MTARPSRRARRLPPIALWVLLAVLAFTGLSGAADWQGGQRVYLVSNGWHTGIVVPHVPSLLSIVPEAADFPGAGWIEFGWGDREYYPAEDPGVGMALSALFTPTPAVMHVAGYASSPPRRYPKAEIAALDLSGDAMARLLSFVAGSFERPAAAERGARVSASGPGLYRDSLFYPATGRFSLANTCNTWVARALAAAGVPVMPEDVQTAAQLLEEATAAGAVKVRGSQ